MLVTILTIWVAGYALRPVDSEIIGYAKIPPAGHTYTLEGIKIEKKKNTLCVYVCVHVHVCVCGKEIDRKREK